MRIDRLRTILLLVPTLLLTAATPQAHCQSPGKARKANALYERGVLQNQEGLLVAASVSLTDSIALDPSRAETYYQRGLSFAGLEQRQAAIRDFRAAIDRGITNIDPYLRVFAWCHEQELHQDGISVAQRMIEAMPFNEGGATWEIGRFHEESGDVEAALASFRHALTLADAGDEEFRDLLQQAIERVSP